MDGNVERLLRAITTDEYPLLAELLQTDAGPLIRTELERLLQRRWAVRAPRKIAEVLGQISGDGFDETIMLRNISTSGVLALVDTSSPIQLDATDLILRVQTATLTLEVPVTLVRVSPLCASQLEAAFRFRSLSTAQRTALDNLRHLLTINRRPVPSRNSAERT